jgi:hypothetical protein
MAASARHGSRRRRITVTLTSAATLAVVMCLGWATAAQATMRVVNQLDPAGALTQVPYKFIEPTTTVDFVLGDRSTETFGGNPGQYTAQALPPSGWVVADIQCVGPRGAADFAIDVPNGRVTFTHVNPATDNQTCTFTVRQGSSGSLSGSSSPPSTVAPAPPASELPGVVIPQKSALLSVAGGRHFARVTIRVPRHAVVTGKLLWHKTAVVGQARTVHAAGTYSLRIPVSGAQAARLQQRAGKSRVPLGLRLVVKETHGPTRVFGYSVIVTM